jgi:hypothetical protein
MSQVKDQIMLSSMTSGGRPIILNLFVRKLMFETSNAELRCRLETRANLSLSNASEMIDCSSIEIVEVLHFV